MDDLWPLAALRVRSGDLELRYMDDADVQALARVAAEGIHAPEAMPFTVPWTRGTPTEVARSILTYQWEKRAAVTPEKWTLELAVVRDGEVLGIQALMASDFLVTRTAETGSWLGLRHHGRGVGTRMRLMILHLFFEGFDGLRATTSAFDDNAPSNAVTRRIGYAENGVEVLAREGKPAVSRRYVLDRAAWDARPAELRPDVRLVGVDGAREQLGI
ncbi:GNAT family N-acetyltransferase [Cellulomonas sp. Leaf395]|uniref:GNAT family N-acetyltransferase n=1 Tax=Cellulomonas sp. Leaf395 TaxID=1736362 RepID=UPI0006F5E241|nr:GNAT family protein [Cellulomonas sp. Leaf395]KQT01891.1 GCN5 family acetyltransferase [Cellulomonas sp. Leaf395]